MKKLHLFFTACLPLLILCYPCLGQTSGWPTRYENVHARAMTIDEDGNIYITATGDGGKKAGVDFVTFKYTPDGELEWTARYNGPSSGEDFPYAIAVDESGHVYVTGRSFVNNLSKGLVNFDYATVKYDQNGVQVWASRYNSPGNRNDVSKDVKVGPDGYIYVTGYSDAEYVLGPGNSITTIKYDPSSGAELWKEVYDVLPNINGGPGEEANSIAFDASGNISIAGTAVVKYDKGTHAILWEDHSTGNRRKVLIDASDNVFTTGFSGKTNKYDKDGNSLWQTSSSAGFWDMALDQTGNVYVTGNIGDENGNSGDFWTVKYDGNNNGAEQWSRRYNGSANSTDFGRSITVDNSGNVFVTGHSTATSGRNTISIFRIIKYNNMGTEQWVSTEPGDGFVIRTDAWDNVYATGTVPGTRLSSAATMTFKYAPTNPAPKPITSTPIVETSQMNFRIHNYPNPFSQSTIIEYQLPQEGKVKLTVFDLSGHQIATLVNEYKPAGVHKINFKPNKLSAGTYFYRIQAGEYTETKKLIVVR
jgi:hypothetical protein